MRLTNDTNAPPLLAVACPRLLHGAIQLRVGFSDVVLHLVGSLVDLHDLRLLHHNLLVELLVQTGELDEVLLDLLNGFVPALDGPERGLRLATAVALKQLGWISKQET